VNREEWRAIPGFEDCYEVSNRGRVKGLRRFRYNRFVRERFLKGGLSEGYPSVALARPGQKTIYRRVHVLVASLFIEKSDPSFFVNHKNGIKTDNRV